MKVLDVNISYPLAGWSFWVHDCDDVAFDRVSTGVDVDFPNADGIRVKDFVTHDDKRPGTNRYPTDHYLLTASIEL